MNHSALTYLYAVLAGIAVAAGLELLIHGLWDGYYSHYPLRGYEGAMAAGLVKPALYHSARGMVHGALVFLLAGAVIMAGGSRRLPVAGAFATAALIVQGAFALARPEVGGSNLGALTPFFLIIYFGPPFVVGAALGSTFGWWHRRGQMASRPG